jgi:hypothetical protein
LRRDEGMGPKTSLFMSPDKSPLHTINSVETAGPLPACLMKLLEFEVMSTAVEILLSKDDNACEIYP